MAFNPRWPPASHDQLQEYTPYFLENGNMPLQQHDAAVTTFAQHQPLAPGSQPTPPPLISAAPHISSNGDHSAAQFDNRRCGGRTSVALACVGCRSRHLKCDAASPNCT